jgi:uncharacterized protein YjiS (DUF1127 family)
MNTMSRAAIRPARSGWSGGLTSWIGIRQIKLCAHALASYWDRRAAIKLLRELDERELRDIGLLRCQIEAAVGGALNPDMGRFR